MIRPGAEVIETSRSALASNRVRKTPRTASLGTTGNGRRMYVDEFDEAYLRKLRRGDLSTEEHFTNHFYGLLLIKLRNRLRATQDIEDVLQETLMRVLRQIREKSGLREANRLPAYVNTTCNNVLCEHFRADKKYAPVNLDFNDPADPTTDLDAPLIDEERTRLVRAVLRRLGRRDRSILRKFYLEECDQQEICRVMKIKPAYLRVLLHRARKRFRQVLEAGKPIAS